MMNPHAASKNKIEFKIKLAGVCIAVKANYKSTKEFLQVVHNVGTGSIYGCN